MLRNYSSSFIGVMKNDNTLSDSIIVKLDLTNRDLALYIFPSQTVIPIFFYVPVTNSGKNTQRSALMI